MALEIKQTVRLSQQLVITPQLQQAIRLLQLSRQELAEAIEKEMVENPVLEEADTSQPDQEERAQDAADGAEQEPTQQLDGESHANDEVISKDGEMKEPHDFDWENYMEAFNTPYPGSAPLPAGELPTYENTLTEAETLYDHLLWQLHLSNFSEDEIPIATEIIGNINDDGYFTASIAEVAGRCGTTEDRVKIVLNKVQQLDPAGVAARDLAECLTIQAYHLGVDVDMIRTLATDHLHDLQTHNYPAIARKLKCDPDEIRQMASVIQHMEPKPGRPFGENRAQYITPDVYVHKLGDDYVVSLNEDGLPKLQISKFYRQTLMQGSSSPSSTKEYVQERLKSAMWLIKSIHQRQQTLYKVTKSIFKFQRDFLDTGVEHLKPMVLRDVAEDINMHESTVSRVTTNKYVHTPRGIFELKFFFNSTVPKSDGEGIASESVKALIEKMVQSEDSRHPLSDQEIVAMLKQKDIAIARRTVAKYREMLGISPSSKRKRFE